ncbi:hypothetical protein [Spirosoma sp. KNUC1025]|uniref:hypothetical protein n=1 Tax=Spirosoma sp. KNUC1025 TaxID=2894082 RepID=UPI00386C2B2F|nr:hypothetical protein LN737_06940 [Spirosoma sp. KNUC1025]
MNISQMSQTLFYLIEQQADSEKAVNYLRQQADAFQKDPQTATFYRVFTAMPRFVGKQPIDVPSDMAFALERIRPGFTVSGWTMDRLARVWWLLQLPADEQATYTKTISELFKAGELNELVALYSALPVLAYPSPGVFRQRKGYETTLPMCSRLSCFITPTQPIIWTNRPGIS